MNTPNAQANAAPAPAAPVSTEPLEDGFAALMDRLRDNPRPFIVGTVGVGLVVLALVIGIRTWRSSTEGKTTEIAAELMRAGSAATPAERVAILNDLKKKTEADPSEAQRLYSLAISYREIAEAAQTNDEKKDAWSNCAKAAGDLVAKFPNSAWVKLVGRPGSADAKPNAVALKSFADDQLKWLADHPFVPVGAPDKDLTVTFELENGGKFKIGKFNSKVAPLHTQNFVNLARDGYFVGTGIGNLKNWYRAAAATTTQSIVGVEMGDAMTRVTPDDRTDDGAEPEFKNDLPYSLPDEPSAAKIARGSLVMRMNSSAGGNSPTRFTIYAEEIAYPQGTPFAEVIEGLDVIEGVMKGETDADRTDRLKTLVKIKNVTVEGSVANPPTNAHLPKFNADMLPKSEAKKPEATDTTKTESR
jgi:cyclophilin family peptidyl-prolyl cis-trans isomerase